jgi:HNH endonuclease
MEGIKMPYVNKARPYKKEYKQQVERGELPARMERQRARNEMDKKGVKRAGKVIDHITPLSKGGTNTPSNLKLTSRAKNASFSRNSDHTVKKNKPK